MHRFRRKSDAKRTTLTASDQEQNLQPLDVLPQLPTNDFRSSLILPDLSRRFSLLRSVGDPLLLDQLRSRLADQRARGAENQITEEEEEMFIETLEHMRPRNAPTASHDSIDEGEMGARNSMRSTTTSSVSSSPSSRSTKRYSNNLFGSGRLRDYTYLKSVASSRTSASSGSRTVSLAPTEASEKTLSSSSFRPVTPDASSNSLSSVQSSPNEKGGMRSSQVPSTPYGEQVITAAEYRLQKTLGPSVLKRASMALDEAIREIEDEVEDEILLPRSVPVPRGSLEQSAAEVRHSKASSASSVFEGGMAISIDQTIQDEFSDRRASPAPARTVPGYVPGMPRPMTPRDVDFDEQRSHSTTPRAQSPYTDPPPSSPTPTGNMSTTKLRHESISSTSKASFLTPVPATPLFLQRSTNGRYTPDDSHRSGDATELDSSLSSSILGRRRPGSPLSTQPYQPMTVSTRPSSRPSTPSNVIWGTNPNNGHKNHSLHSRNNSWVVDGMLNTSDIFGTSTAQQPSSRSLRSPPPDSQTTEPSQGVPTSISPQAYIPETDFGSPILAAMLAPRSGTPTQIARRSPISPAFPNFELTSRSASSRPSKQNPPSSPFNVGSFSSLGFSPRANSSRSSLDSAGSSFRSWDEDDKILSLFSDPKEKQPAAWHDFDTDKSSSVTPGGVSADDEEWDPEEIIKRYAGLGKGDIAAIQEKLVTAAFAKIANTDPRDRAPSALRRRRPSTSQSNYQRIASPPPQVQPPASPSPYPSDEQSSKASALLNSMVESIKGQKTIALDTTTPPTDDKDLSPNTRRNRDLAHVLFGDDELKEPTTTTKEEPAQSKTDPEPLVIPNITTIASSPPPLTGDTTPLTSPSPYLLTRNPSLPRIPQKLKEETDLAREVQQKAEAAMMALKKDPSKANLGDNLKHTPSLRKRIDPTQISTPRLVSASTSVDTIPLRPPSISSNTTSSASKLGSRFKKLRGSLRVRNVLSSSDETVVQDPKSPPPSQAAHYDPAKLNTPGGPSVASATETGRFKVSVPTPPASAGPGLKGFMARFRNRQRMSEVPSSERSMPRAASPLSQSQTTSPTTPRQTDITPAKPNASITNEKGLNSITPRPAGQARPMYSRFPPANTVTAPAPPPVPVSSPPPPTPAETLNNSQSAAALEQLYAAAINLGVDQDALNDLVARSGSTSSRNLLARNNSIQVTPRRDLPEQTITTQQVSYVGSTASDQTATPTSYGPQSLDQPSNNNNITSDNERVAPSEEQVTRKSSIRKADHLRRPKEGQTDAAANAVVRRTIIYASDSGLSATEFAAMIQRKNSSRRRRISANSISNRSVHDRAPTPPPPKTPGAKRFSADGMPPIPQIPTSLGQALNTNAPSTSAGGIEKSNSTYDSLYEMYSGESRVPSMTPVESNGLADQQGFKGEQGAAESGPALEVIQLANGETIWSIVNGLRDAEDESIYTGRTSFASEYSTREPGNDNSSIFVKEHGRQGSRGSASSLVSKRKPQPGKARPETKVFHSSSAQIGRLIESLSQGVDSGSFNFLPNVSNRGPGHSASSSLSTNDINWTVEERLDRMLGAMNNNNS